MESASEETYMRERERHTHTHTYTYCDKPLVKLSSIGGTKHTHIHTSRCTFALTQVELRPREKDFAMVDNMTTDWHFLGGRFGFILRREEACEQVAGGLVFIESRGRVSSEWGGEVSLRAGEGGNTCFCWISHQVFLPADHQKLQIQNWVPQENHSQETTGGLPLHINMYIYIYGSICCKVTRWSNFCPF